MTFFGLLPSSARCTASSVNAAASISAGWASRATVTSPRFATPFGLAFRGRSLLVTNLTGADRVRGTVVRAATDESA